MVAPKATDIASVLDAMGAALPEHPAVGAIFYSPVLAVWLIYTGHEWVEANPPLFTAPTNYVAKVTPPKAELISEASVALAFDTIPLARIVGDSLGYDHTGITITHARNESLCCTVLTVDIDGLGVSSRRIYDATVHDCKGRSDVTDVLITAALAAASDLRPRRTPLVTESDLPNSKRHEGESFTRLKRAIEL
jgi:hypothetical protein